MSNRLLRPAWRFAMTRNAFGAGVAAATLACLASPLASAQTLPEPFRACAAEADDARRLACFDAAVTHFEKGAGRDAKTGVSAAPAVASPSATAPAIVAPGAAPQSTVPVAATTAAAEQTLSPEERFGLRGDLKREKTGEMTELVATATAISAKPHGELVITLDNGQVWAEIAPGSAMRLKVGDPVKIEAGSMRSFILLANGRSSKVTRVR
jgi:hypothetical protein